MALWGKTDVEASKPKYLSDTLVNGQSVSNLDSTNGVSVVEATNATNRGKGITTPGWVNYRTYTDAQGNTRNKSEVLVAFSSITGDSDTLPPTPVITIGTQPADVTIDLIEDETATFTVAATVTDGTLSYQWQKQEGGAGAWSTIVGATSTAYTTGVLTVADDNTDKYRVVVSVTNGTPVTSSAATLTVVDTTEV
jgi:hypothetical protein